MKMVMEKQRHQMARHQLPIAPLSLPMLATREKATHMEIACGGRRKQHRVFTSCRIRIIQLVGMVL